MSKRTLRELRALLATIRDLAEEAIHEGNRRSVDRAFTQIALCASLAQPTPAPKEEK